VGDSFSLTMTTITMRAPSGTARTTGWRPPIVDCAGVADVVRAAELARSEDPVVAVRGGGHSLPGFSTCDGGSTNQDGQ
jgi:FAD/FMN-containing dehydrogenase